MSPNPDQPTRPYFWYHGPSPVNMRYEARSLGSEAVFQPVISWSNAEWKNMYCMLVTLETSHLEMSWLNSFPTSRPSKRPSMRVTWETSQSPIAAWPPAPQSAPPFLPASRPNPAASLAKLLGQLRSSNPTCFVRNSFRPPISSRFVPTNETNICRTPRPFRRSGQLCLPSFPNCRDGRPSSRR